MTPQGTTDPEDVREPFASVRDGLAQFVPVDADHDLYVADLDAIEAEVASLRAELEEARASARTRKSKLKIARRGAAAQHVRIEQLEAEVASLRAELEGEVEWRTKMERGYGSLRVENRRLTEVAETHKQRAHLALDREAQLREENQKLREATDDLIRFVLRPDYDWVEDWQETREYAARARAALRPNPEETS